MSGAKTVVGAYAKIEAHEDICAVRYAAIETNLGDLKETLKELKGSNKQHERAAWGIVLTLVAWMAVQLWNGQVVHPAPVPIAAGK